jgi:hypothetical protein
VQPSKITCRKRLSDIEDLDDIELVASLVDDRLGNIAVFQELPWSSRLASVRRGGQHFEHSAEPFHTGPSPPADGHLA